MLRKESFAGVGVITAVLTAGALALFASPAFAASVGESVSGTTLSNLSLTAGTGAVFATNFNPGATATSTGALTATDTNPSWTLQVKDASGNPTAGKMVETNPALVACSGSEANITQALSVSVTAPLSVAGITTNSAVALSGTNQQVASATSALLAANVFTTNYSQTIPSGDVMAAGCPYSLTATYTLQ